MNEWDELFELMGVPGRTFGVKVYGDDVGELELAALENAEQVFGPGVPMAVIPAYHVYWLDMDEVNVTGKRYGAYIHVLARTAARHP